MTGLGVSLFDGLLALNRRLYGPYVGVERAVDPAAAPLVPPAAAIPRRVDGSLDAAPPAIETPEEP